MRWIKQAYTQNDNRTSDPKALAAWLCTFGILLFQGYSVHSGQHFSATDFGIGAGGIWGSYGLGRKLDDDTTETEDLSGKAKP